MAGAWQKSLFLCSLAATSLYGISSKGPVYTAQSYGNPICALDPAAGTGSIIATVPEGVVDLSILNPTTLYALTDANNIWAVNIQTGAIQLVTPTPLALSFAIAIEVANNSTAYVVDYTGATISSVNLQTGSSSLLTPAITGDFLTDIAIGNNSTAYVSGQLSNLVYAINLETGAYEVVTPNPVGDGLFGIALANNDLAYVLSDGDSNVYSVNLQTGAFSLVTSTPLPGASEAINIGLPNNTTAYSVDDDRTPAVLYTINLTNGSSVAMTFPSLTFEGFEGIALLQQMDTSIVSGNNLKLARYINKNAPIDMIRLFALLPDSQLPQALESISPVRNTLATFASQNGYLATSQIVADHSRQKRFLKQSEAQTLIAASEIATDELFADASMDDTLIANFAPVPRKTRAPKQECVCYPIDPYTAWGAGFGEYAREKSQDQTPAFNMDVGGVIFGFDLNGLEDKVLGFGGAYVHTHVHEDKKAGYANVNQGFLTTYGTFTASDWYFDLGLWGGYYSLKNHRNISFPNFQATARSTTTGWQLAPHFEVGYDGWQYKRCYGPWYGFEPFLMADWVANWEKGFKEHGAETLNMGQKGRFCSLFRGETGFRLNQIAKFDWGRIVFLEKLSYAYQKAFHTGTITTFIVGVPGSFSVATLTGAQNLGVGEFSMLFIFNNPDAPYVNFRYQGEFSSHYQSHQAVLEIGKAY